MTVFGCSLCIEYPRIFTRFWFHKTLKCSFCFQDPWASNHNWFLRSIQLKLERFCSFLDLSHKRTPQLPCLLKNLPQFYSSHACYSPTTLDDFMVNFPIRLDQSKETIYPDQALITKRKHVPIPHPYFFNYFFKLSLRYKLKDFLANLGKAYLTH